MSVFGNAHSGSPSGVNEHIGLFVWEVKEQIH
jgi:hypothetical protein